jgi:hypothetical protein
MSNTDRKTGQTIADAPSEASPSRVDASLREYFEAVESAGVPDAMIRLIDELELAAKLSEKV